MMKLKEYEAAGLEAMAAIGLAKDGLFPLARSIANHYRRHGMISQEQHDSIIEEIRFRQAMANTATIGFAA